MQSNNTNNIINENDIKANQEAKIVNQKWLDENAIGYLNTIKDFLKNNEVDKSLSEKYLKFIEKCDTLSTKIGDLSKLDNEGKEEKITLEQKDELLTYYQSVAEAIDDIKKDVKETKDNILFDNVNNIGNVISKDIRSFIKMTEPQTISEVVQNGRKRVINITGQEVKKVGANLSSRQIIKDGNEKKVFTQDYVPRQDGLIDKVFTEFKEKYPEYEEYFQMLNTKSLTDHLKYTANVQQYDNGDLKYEMDIDRLNDIIFKKEEDGFSITDVLEDEEINKLQSRFINDTTFQSVMHFFLRSIQSAKSQIAFMKQIECKDNEPVNERNSGMSVVAELLGIGNVICHSEAVTIKDGEKEINGTMMNFAKGTDVKNFKIDDPIGKYKEEDVKITKEAKKQIADLQVLDYICGNLDRHGANLFYNFDTSNPNEPKLVGIEGIDNDASFFTDMNISEVEGHNRMIGLTGLKIIDKQTADRIKSISPSMLKIALKGLKINETALDLAIYRFTTLQSVLNKSKVIDSEKDITYKEPSNKLVDAEISIIKDEEAWEALDIYKINEKNTEKGKANKNLFNTVYKHANGLSNLGDFTTYREKLLETKISLERKIKKNKADVSTKKKNVDNGTHFFRGSSSQYRDVQKALKKVKAAEKRLKNHNDATYFENYLKQLENLNAKADIYIAKKEQQRRTQTFDGYTQNRIDTVTALKADVVKLIDDYRKDQVVFQKGYDDLKARKEKCIAFALESKTRKQNQKEIQATKQADYLKKQNSKDVQNQLVNDPNVNNISKANEMDSKKIEVNKEKGKNDKEKTSSK